MTTALSPEATQSLRIAAHLLGQGQLDEADALLAQLAARHPGNAEVHYVSGVSASLRGDAETALAKVQAALKLDRGDARYHFQAAVLLDQLGRHRESPPRYRDAIRLNPKLVEAHYNLGLALQNSGDSDGAIRSYRQALAQRPQFLEALNNLGNVLQARGQHQEALQCFRDAIRVRPDFAVPYNNLGNSLVQLGDRDQAIAAYRRALELAPSFSEALGNLAEQLQLTGQKEEAIQRYETLVAMQPENANARFALAALKQENPASAPDSFVQKVFDELAPRFDAHLVETLGYQIPGELMLLLTPWLSEREKVDVLDLGCGTGLFGAVIRPFARSLVGLDLSAAMVAKCRSGGHYDRVEQGELTRFLGTLPDASVDVVAATDVFVYVGDLTQVFAEAARVLRVDGRFGFSIETVESGDFQLRDTNRFAQTKSYIERLAAANGFKMAGAVDTPIRKEAGAPIPGWLVVLQKR